MHIKRCGLPFSFTAVKYSNSTIAGVLGAMAGPARRHVTTSIKELEEVPLFMTELPAADEGENDALEALRSLVYDDTPEGGC